MRIGLVLLFSFTYIEATLSLQMCPPGPLWGIRANNTCQNKDNYHCLLDTEYTFRNEERYKETCLSPKRYKGVQYVYSGDLDARDCNPSRFSPVPYWSNTGFECPLMKSSCNEEGQVIAKNGTKDTDRSCRCDYRKMYDYVVKPADPCHCHPMEEDCSCYINRCSSTSQILSQDYSCVEKDQKQTFICTSIEDQTMEEVQTHLTKNLTKTNSLLDTSSYNSEFSPFLKKYTVMKIVTKYACNQIAFMGTLSMLSTIVVVIGLLVVLIWRRCGLPVHVQRIYRQQMTISPFYVETKQLQMLKDHFTNKSLPRFVILEGCHGIGKTQTSIKFCKDTENSYSIVAVISPSEDLTLEEALVKLFSEDLRINILRSSGLTLGTILETFGQFMNHDSRKGCPCLLVIDIPSNISPKQSFAIVQNFLEFQKSIPNLNLIFETVDTTLSSNFRNCPKIKFQGMDIDECLELFKDIINDEDLQEDRNSVETLVNTIGKIPLVLVSAICYMQTTSTPSNVYCQMSKDAKTYFEAIRLFQDKSYSKEVLNKLNIPLNHMQNYFKQDRLLWELFTVIPLLDYNSISVVVLEACYLHLTKCDYQKTQKVIERLILKMENLSWCQTQEDYTFTYRSNADKKREKLKKMMFHVLKIKALEYFSNVSEERENWIKFLLKSFCYEIDIDARTDVVVTRNLLFFNHAEKLLTYFGELNCHKDNEFRFYQAYLHCALGSTLLYHRQNVESAHVHLMKARHVALSIVGDKSRYAKKICSRISSTDGSRQSINAGLSGSNISFQEISAEKINEVTDSIFRFSFGFQFTKDFFHGTRRSHHDVDILKKEGIEDLKMFNEHYLSATDYHYLLNLKLVLPIQQMRSTLLVELFMWICQNNARSLIDLKYIIPEDDPNLRKTCKEECSLAKHFSEIAVSKGLNLFACLENYRSIHMLLRLSERDTDVPKLEKDFEDLESMLKRSETDSPYFGFGFIKVSCKSNFRHTILCRPILLRYLRKIILKLKDEDERHKLREKGRSITIELRRQLNDMKAEDLIYDWLSVPFALIECAKFLQIALEIYEDALKCFKEALTFEEEKREVFWTRYIKDSYIGQIECLFKLDKPVEAKDLYKSVKGKLEGTNRENLIDFFQQRYKRCKADYRSAKLYDRCELDHESTILHDRCESDHESTILHDRSESEHESTMLHDRSESEHESTILHDRCESDHESTILYDRSELDHGSTVLHHRSESDHEST